jgi:hypothetical protein
MSFEPSEHSNYGWASAYPASSLIAGSSMTGRGVTIPSQYNRNASMLSDMLAKIPFKLEITSAYRDAVSTRAVGSSSKSQHTKAAAADIKASLGGVKIPNFVLGTWLYVNQKKFPRLDQIITYTGKGHLHVSVSDKPRKEFLVSTSGQYRSWKPNPADLPMHLTGIDPRVVRSWLPQVVIMASVSAVAVALTWRYQNQIRALVGR